MNWNGKDVETYFKEKQFVDTAIIPLLPLRFDEGGMKQAAQQGEFIQLLSTYLEKQFKGRLFLFPPFSYLEQEKEKGERLRRWEEQCKQQGFVHVFYLTSDPEWKTYEDILQGTVLWVPSVPLEHVDRQFKHSLMDDQVKQLIQLIVHKWQHQP
jgi:hypothetical protein